MENSEIKKFFSLGYFENEDFNDKLVLLSLIGLVYTKTKVKDPNIECSNIIRQIAKGMKNIDDDFINCLASLVEELCYGVKKIDSCGMKTSKEIINKIREILSTWSPF